MRETDAFPYRFLLAPLAGITDMAFRKVCAEEGAQLVFTEMVSSDGLVYNVDKTSQYLKKYKGERNISVQLFGHKIDIIEKAVEILNEHDFVSIDFNAGCPVKKVVKNGNGSALLKDLSLLEKIMAVIKKKSKHPVSLKIRKGFDKNENIVPQVVDIANDLGLFSLTIHGRTRSQMFSGEADWNVIKAAKGKAKIPIIGNGDIFSYEDYKEKALKIGVGGVMIGRGCLGNPFIFRELKNKRRIMLTKEDRMNAALKHFSYLCAIKPEKRAVNEMKKHWGWYSKGCSGSSAFRRIVFSINTKNDVINEVKKFIEKPLNEKALDIL